MKKNSGTKKVFEKPDAIILEFNADDIIVTSSGPGDPYPGGDNWRNGF